MTESTTAPRVVRRDVYPAEVEVAGTHYRSALAVVTADRLYLYVGDRQLVLDEPYDPATATVPRHNAPPREPTHLTLTDGREVHVRRQRGCGCGSPLKGWRPWQPYRVGA